MKTELTTTSADPNIALQDLACLYEITKHLASAARLQDCLEKIVAILADSKGMENGTVTIVNPVTRELEIEVAHGISSSAKSRGRYKLGGGVTGKVIETGRPVAVPKIDDEPLFLDRTGARSRIDKSRISFICVPIKEGRRVVGALSVDRGASDHMPLEEDIRLLMVISSLIAQKVALLEKINREK
jgi:Nif-specific regulatory protein